MAIDYIQKGVASITAAEKIKLAFEERRNAVNPWLPHRLMPAESEGLKKGGGRYRFVNTLGYDEVERRASAPTSNQVDYTNGAKVAEVEMTVSQPYETKLYTFEDSDAIQLDGIDFSAKSSKKVMNVLIKAEIKEETAKIMNNTSVRAKALTGTTALDQLKELKQLTADYYDISATNGWDTEATKYFDAGLGDFTAEELRLHLHPKKIAEYSDVNTEAGAGSELQFLQFQNGTLTHVNGIQVVSNKYVTKSKGVIIPNGMIGVPDSEVMKTIIKPLEIEETNTKHIRGWHYFDAILVAPELVTIITLEAEAPAKASK